MRSGPVDDWVLGGLPAYVDSLSSHVNRFWDDGIAPRIGSTAVVLDWNSYGGLILGPLFLPLGLGGDSHVISGILNFSPPYSGSSWLVKLCFHYNRHPYATRRWSHVFYRDEWHRHLCPLPW